MKSKLKGLPCRSPVVRGKKRCRMHGGSKGSGAQCGNTNALTYGLTTGNAKEFRRAVKIALFNVKKILPLI